MLSIPQDPGYLAGWEPESYSDMKDNHHSRQAPHNGHPKLSRSKAVTLHDAQPLNTMQAIIGNTTGPCMHSSWAASITVPSLIPERSCTWWCSVSHQNTMTDREQT